MADSRSTTALKKRVEELEEQLDEMRAELDHERDENRGLWAERDSQKEWNAEQFEIWPNKLKPALEQLIDTSRPELLLDFRQFCTWIENL